MSLGEAASAAAISGLVLWVHLETGRWMAEILMAHLPEFL